jgi:hypothetical protein
MDLSVSEYTPEKDFCQHVAKHSGRIKFNEFALLLRNCWLHKRVSAVDILCFFHQLAATLGDTLYTYTGCPRRNVTDFWRVFLMLNTYVQSLTVTKIMAREECGLLAAPRTIPVS